MRIIAGTHKRREIKAPKGMNTRPTGDRAKEAVFSTLGDKVKDALVLDLFSGSGNLAFESIIRGANFAYLVENDKNAYYTIMENVKRLEMEDKLKVFHLGWDKFLDKAEYNNLVFDLIFLDPPYYGKYYTEVLKSIAEKNILSEDGVIIVEAPVDLDKGIFNEKSFEIVKEAKYGDTKIFYFQKRGV